MPWGASIRINLLPPWPYRHEPAMVTAVLCYKGETQPSLLKVPAPPPPYLVMPRLADPKDRLNDFVSPFSPAPDFDMRRVTLRRKKWSACGTVHLYVED